MTHSFKDSYDAGFMPWNYSHPTPDLVAVIDGGLLKGSTVLDIGCGTGSDANELARRGFRVTAIDLVPRAVQLARARAVEAGQLGRIDHRIGDFLEARFDAPFDAVYDRGVYHYLRRFALERFLEQMRKVTRPGTRWLSLSGNAKEQAEVGPPRVHEHQIRSELGGLFRILDLRETKFVTDDPTFTPLAWATLLERRGG